MNIIAVDIGSYSVKFLNVSTNKKSFKIIDYKEVVLSKIESDVSDPEQIDIISKLHIEVINEYLYENLKDHKVVFNLPADTTTSRFLKLPVNSKKKANMMVPFQLDEELPHSINDIHYTSTLLKQDDSFKALVNITQMSFFESIFDHFKSKSILPHTITSGVSIIESCAKEYGTNETICLFDLGHTTTEVYFFNKDGVIAAHHSHIAGATIDNILSKTYDISLKDDSTYKHENCFFLSEKQYENVDEDQREFAKLMATTFRPLVQDFRRWIMGLRIKDNIVLDRIFLTGGTANIKNIDNFFSVHLSTHVELFDSGNLREVEKEKRLSFNQSSLICTALQSKKVLANFLSGNFSSTTTTETSIHSTTFLLTRSLIIAFIILGALTIERAFFLSPENKNLDRIIKKLLKNEVLEVPKKTRRLFPKKNKRVLSYFKKKDKIIIQEVRSIQSATKTNALLPLSKLSKVLQNNKLVDLVKFENIDDIAMATFESSNQKEIKLLAKHLKNSSLQDLEIIEKERNKKKELTIKYSGL